MEKNMTLILVLAFGIIILGLAAVLGPNLADDDEQEETITASGTAQLEAVADEITVHVRVESTGKTASEAQDWLDDTVEEVIAAITQPGTVKKEQIETTQYSVQEWREWERDKSVLKGYKAVQSMKITMTEPAVAGKVIDLAVTAGAFVDYLNFGFSKQKEKQLKEQALKEAAQQAKHKAESVADGLGVELGDIVSVSESEANYPMYRMAGPEMMMAKADAAVAEPSISPQTLQVTAQVSVAYEIE